MAVTLSIGNMAEVYAPHVATLPASAGARWRGASHRISGHALFWGLDGADRVVVLPGEVDGLLLDELFERIGCPVPRVIVATGDPSALCRNLASDERAIDSFLSFAGGGGVALQAWGETSGLHQLAARLEEEGVRVSHDYGDREHQWVAHMLDSKAGFRALVSGIGSAEVRMAAGVVAADINEAALKARTLAGGLYTVVVKADRGASGVCHTLIAPGGRMKMGVLNHLLIAARSIEELSGGPLVVERYISDGMDTPRSVSAQCLITDGNAHHRLFTASHINGPGGAGLGGVVGVGAVEEGLEEKIGQAAKIICNEVAAAGYRGRLGLDFAVDVSGGLWTLEMNARRTTFSAVHELLSTIAKAQGGGGLCALYDEQLPLPLQLGDWTTFKSKAPPLLFPLNGEPEGWLPIPAPAAGPGHGWLAGGVVVARSVERAYQIAGEMRGWIGVEPLPPMERKY